MHNIKIITSTTREGRKGIAVAQWITSLTSNHQDTDVELLDLAQINLPLMNEPNHPVLRKYQYEHTKRWSAMIAPADAFIIVLSEYNHSFPAPIKNAIDYLSSEWKYKPVGIVSYGGISAGLRSTEMLKQVISTLGMMPIPEQVSVPFFTKFITEEGVFVPDPTIEKSASAMLTELLRWSDALKPLRAKV